MENIIKQACYSFLCQHLVLSSNPTGFEDSPFDQDTLRYTVGSILASIMDGVNIFANNPEKLAVTDIKKRMSKNSGLDFKLPPSYPFESLNLWFTPKIFDPESEKTTKAYHFIHTMKLNTNAFNLTYVICNKLKDISEDINMEWDVLPLSILITLDDSIMKTPLLPLPGIKNAENFQLRQKIIDIKSGKEGDSNFGFYSLTHKKLTEEEEKHYMFNYLMPGIFQFFFGFLEKLNTNKLKQTPESIEPIIMDNEEIFPKIKFQNVSLI